MAFDLLVLLTSPAGSIQFVAAHTHTVTEREKKFIHVDRITQQTFPNSEKESE